MSQVVLRPISLSRASHPVTSIVNCPHLLGPQGESPRPADISLGILAIDFGVQALCPYNFLC